MVTFDLFSSLVDSRSGGGAVFGAWALERGWPVAGETVYDAWDRANKRRQRLCETWEPYRALSTRALSEAYHALGLDAASAAADAADLEESMTSWPLWPDVAAFLAAPHGFGCGILSNVDEALFGTTPVAPLVERALVLTSELLRAYKPSPRIYRRAAERTPDWVHVASSARDVRGALEADVRTVRLARPGHAVDGDGPSPPVTVDSLDQVDEAVRRARPSHT